MAKISSDKSSKVKATKKGGKGSGLGSIRSSAPDGGKVDGNPTADVKKGSPRKGK
jgi:hypothetical protein